MIRGINSLDDSSSIQSSFINTLPGAGRSIVEHRCDLAPVSPIKASNNLNKPARNRDDFFARIANQTRSTDSSRNLFSEQPGNPVSEARVSDEAFLSPMRLLSTPNVKAVQTGTQSMTKKQRAKLYECRDSRVLQALDAMKQCKQDQEMSARIQPKHDATFKSAGRIGGAAIASGGVGRGKDVLARRQGDRFTQGVLSDVKVERDRLQAQAHETKDLKQHINNANKPVSDAKKNSPDLEGWRQRLLSRSVKATRGKARFLQDSSAPTVDADLLRGQLKRDPESFSAIGDTDTVERMLDVLGINQSVASLRAVHVSRMQGAQAGIDDMWQAAKAHKERDTVQSAYHWRKKYKMQLTSTQRLQLEMFMPDQERIARDRQQRKSRLQDWANMVGGDPVVDVDALE